MGYVEVNSFPAWQSPFRGADRIAVLGSQPGKPRK